MLFLFLYRFSVKVYYFCLVSEGAATHAPSVCVCVYFCFILLAIFCLPTIHSRSCALLPDVSVISPSQSEAAVTCAHTVIIPTFDVIIILMFFFSPVSQKQLYHVQSRQQHLTSHPTVNDSRMADVI